MRSDSIQSLILANTRASDDERDVDIGFYRVSIRSYTTETI